MITIEDHENDCDVQHVNQTYDPYYFGLNLVGFRNFGCSTGALLLIAPHARGLAVFRVDSHA